MKKLLFILALLVCFSAKAQFPSIDSLLKFTDRYIRNSAVEAFTNLRLNTVIHGLADFMGAGAPIDSVYAVNDSTLIIKAGATTFEAVIKGVYDYRRKVDSMYVINDSTIGFTINNEQKSILIRGNGVPLSRTITINGNTQDLAADRTWTLTKADINLDQADNTSDLDKPVSAAQQAALDDTAQALRSAMIPSFISSVQQDTILRYLPMVGWGDSYMAGYPAFPFLSQVGRTLGRYVVNRGVSGETSVQILARFLTEPSKYTWPTIIESGSNNALDTTIVIANIKQMVDSLISRGNEKYIVMGMVIGDYSDQWIGTPNYNTKKRLNDSLATLYGPRFLPMNDFLISCNDGSAGDLEDVAHGVVPRSLRVDPVHLNKKGYDTLAWLISNGYAKYLSADTLNKPVPEQYIYTLLNGKVPAAFSQSLWIRDEGNADVFHVDGEKRIVEKFGLLAYTDTTSNILTNGDFSNGSTGWTATNWTVASNKATHTTGNTSALSQNVSVVPSRMYLIEFTVSDLTTGTVTASLGTTELNSGIGTNTNAINANGIYRANFFSGATATIPLSFTPTSTFDGSISSVKVKYFSDRGNYSENTTTDTTYNTRFYNKSIGIGVRPFAYMTAQGQLNTALGYRAGDKLSVGSQNVFVGADAGHFNDDGSLNVAIGANALSSSSSSIRSVAIGASAGQNSDRGFYNIFIGSNAGLFPTGLSSQNTFIGGQAGQGALNITSVNTNTAIGYRSGMNIAANALENQIFGALAGMNVNGGRRNIVLGYNADLPTAGGNYQLNIANNIFGTGLQGTATAPQGLIGIGTNAPQRLLHTEVRDNITSAVTFSRRNSHFLTSGSATAGFGVGEEDALYSSTGVQRVARTSGTYWEDATNTTESASWSLSLIRAGSLAEAMRIRSTGELNIGNFTDQGAFSFQNTGGMYQNGILSLRGTLASISPFSILGKSTDSSVVQLPAVPVSMGGLPTGGMPSYVLRKVTGSDYDVEWAAPGNVVVQDSTGEYKATINTNNATPTTAATISIPSGTNMMVQVTVLGLTADGSASYGATKYRRFHRDGGGSLTNATLHDIVADEYTGSLATATVTITNSGSDIIVQVTGEAATTIQWLVKYKIISVNNSL